MKVLVAVASRYGSTQEIAYYIGKTLRDQGLEVDVKNTEDVESVQGYQAVVLGSGVYGGKWLKPATVFAKKYRAQLNRVATWLFSSGPIDGKPISQKAVEVKDVMAQTLAKEHKLFGGKIDKARLNFRQKAILYAIKAHEGDFRNWDEIKKWALSIASALNKEDL